jgi:hypothetical protein
MIDNYTHKEWECAQKILKHQGRVNRVFEEMKISWPLRPKPAALSKKMQPAGNIGSEPAETSKKGKAGKTITTTEGTSKAAKATDVLAQRKAGAAKTTLPPIAEKSTKLMKVSENLIRRKTDAAKVAAAEREKKKSQDTTPVVALEKNFSSKRKTLEDSETSKENPSEERPAEATKPSGERQ